MNEMAPRGAMLTAADGSGSPDGPGISVIVPARQEAGNLPGLIDEIEAALAGRSFEVIVVDDGSTDETPSVLAEARRSRPWLRHVRHSIAAGQSAAIRTGLLAARGAIVATIDGDGQNAPAYIPALVDALRQGGPQAGIAAGQRTGRRGTLAKKLSSRFANGLRSAVLRDGTRDTGCGLKAIHRDLFLRLPYFDGWHRYLPALVLREGRGVVHLDVIDRDRRHGRSNYGIFDRGLIGALDLIGVWWLRRRRRHLPEITEIDTP